MKEEKRNLPAKIIPVVFLSLALTLSSCGKRDMMTAPDPEPEENFYALEIPQGEFTILGAERAIPFTVENMDSAYNEVYSTTAGSLEATHHYVRFTPQSNQEYVRLIQSDLDIEDHPLHYEILQMGDKYTDPAVSPGSLQPLYGVVEAGRQLPTQNYDILANLHLYSPDEALVRRAIERIGFNPDSTGYALPGPDWTGPDNPGPDPPAGGYSGPLVRDADCSCRQGGNQRNPAGCIRLEDTQLTPGQCGKGVRAVKVIVKDYWMFSRFTSYTNEGGCFRFYDLEFYGNGWMRTRYKNPQVKVRAFKGNFFADIFSYAAAVRDGTYRYKGPDFRNMDRCHVYVNDFDGRDHRFWRTATIFNAVREFHDWTHKEGFPAGVYRAPSDLILLSTSMGNSGAAPMVHKIYQEEGSVIPLANQAVWGILGIGLPLPSGLGLPIGTFLATFSPDIVINRNNADGMQSDRIKRVCYHELAHAQHFHRLGTGRYGYWLGNITYIINNNGYGDGTQPGAEKTQIIEMWGHHLGAVITDEAYGTSHSNDDLFQGEFFRWRNIMERTMVEHIHLPTGLLYDIFDENLPNDQYEHPNLVGFDHISAYPHALFLEELDENVTSPREFISNFRDNRLQPGDLQVYNTLMTRYGF